MTEHDQDEVLTAKRRKGIARAAVAVTVLGLAVGVVVLRSAHPTAERPPDASTTPRAAPLPSAPKRPTKGPPRTEPLDIRLTPEQYVVVLADGHWYNHALSLSMTVSVTNSGGTPSENPLEVFVSLSPDLMETRDRRGDRWDCREVHDGLMCSNPDVVVPEESWPDLEVDIIATKGCTGTIEVTATGPGVVEEGVRVEMDTST